MKKFRRTILDSLNEFNDVRNVVICALLAAIGVILGYFTIIIGSFVKIGFSSIPLQLVAAFFGPTIGGLFGAALDIINYFVKPAGPYFPGFTLNAILSGIIYGIFFYKKKVSIYRVVVAQFVIIVIINLGLSSYWFYIIFGKSFFASFPFRVLKNLIMWPIDSAILFTIMKALDVAVKPYLNKQLTKVK